MLNLDCETDERLERVNAALNRALVRLREQADTQRENGWGGPIGAPAVKRHQCAVLLQYVCALQRARAARRDGYIGQAQIHEQQCEKIYTHYLPKELRW
jgi:hypothetical protein